MTGPVPALADRAEACADRLLEADRVLVAAHIDADGLTSAAVAARALARAGVSFSVTFERQLDPEAIEGIAAAPHETVLFTDFGSGQLETISEYGEAFTPVIADHHQPADVETEYHCNPLLEGINGASELSGAGAAYVLARALEGDGEDNRDLAPLAVVGAVGDMQLTDGELVGANAAIVEEGVAAGVLEAGTDLAIYGRQTRPLPKLLEYATDVYIPGISNDRGGALRFLEGLDLELRADGEWRRWSDLESEEKQVLASALVRKAMAAGVRPAAIDDLVGTSYVLTAEPVGSVVRDASEFSTLLNATARYDRADVGLAVCLGDRSDALERAETLLADHRRNLSSGIELVAERGTTSEEHCQWFHAGDEIRETIVGIVAGMALGTDGIDRGRPIVAFAEKADEPDAVKVSARGTGRLVGRGLDLADAIGTAARAVGGDGGGHDIAAGATVPSGSETAFLERLDTHIGEQLEESG